ncbi:SubName: Full=Uncharacterized protein {ECO:0000313/EMBL:CCA67402.1} [Serendipita indica DSM 11827]|nr:SubName: Full=Uncharacterized protein {ECO:0000313/EMBL:CCA67402.1} [Serendipita indica DSM 11827]
MAVNSTLAASFSTKFRTDVQAVSDRITNTASSYSQAHKEELISGVSKLRKDLIDATPYLPTYDQRQSELAIKEVERKLEEKLQGGSSASGKARAGAKFSFKKPPPSTTPSPIPPVLEATTTSPSLATQVAEPSAAQSSQIRLGFSNQADSRPEVTLTSLSECVVDLATDSHLLNGSIGALHVTGLKQCVVLVAPVQGSALLHECQESVLAIACHQFRIHTSTRVDVYLHVTSTPILEKCTAMRFAPYNLPAGADLDSEKNRFAEVQDFLWIRSAPSPNWSIMPQEDQLKADAWSDAASAQRLDSTLAKFLQPKSFDPSMNRD